MEEDDEEAVPLPNVNAAILKKVIQWCTYHKDDPPPPEDDENKEKRTDDISSWDAEFLKVDQGTLFELILVSWSQKEQELEVYSDSKNVRTSYTVNIPGICTFANEIDIHIYIIM